MSEAHLFYGKEIVREKQQEFIQQILHKYRNEKASEELKEKIYNDLFAEQHKGNITIPFKVLFKKDETGTHPPCIEVLLDTRV
jgi:hypothetical protein